jgi:hypothetical protein
MDLATRKKIWSNAFHMGKGNHKNKLINISRNEKSSLHLMGNYKLQMSNAKGNSSNQDGLMICSESMAL